MILVDSTVWVDHFRSGDAQLAAYLGEGLVYTHPFIIGEIALGSLHQRDKVLTGLRGLPLVMSATDDEVQAFIEQHPLYSLGIGYVDAHLLAATRLSPGMRLWTRDRRLREIAAVLGVEQPKKH